MMLRDYTRSAPTNHIIGINTTYGVYVSFLIEHDYIPGGTPLRYGFVGGLSISVALLSAPLINVLINQFGFRVPFVAGRTARFPLVLLVITMYILIYCARNYRRRPRPVPCRHLHVIWNLPHLPGPSVWHWYVGSHIHKCIK